MALDAVGYAVAVDAWRYGEADGKRVCVEVLGTGMDPTLALLGKADLQRIMINLSDQLVAYRMSNLDRRYCVDDSLCI
jgi:hypothetical protein